MASAKSVLGAVVLPFSVSAAHAAPFTIVGNDKQIGFDAATSQVINPTGNDYVPIADLAKPEDPKIVANLPIENLLVRPPTNLATSPNGAIALVAVSAGMGPR